MKDYAAGTFLLLSRPHEISLSAAHEGYSRLMRANISFLSRAAYNRWTKDSLSSSWLPFFYFFIGSQEGRQDRNLSLGGY